MSANTIKIQKKNYSDKKMRNREIKFLPFISGINMHMEQWRGSKSDNGLQLVRRVEDKYKPRPSSTI